MDSSISFRENYAGGVENYYSKFGNSYRNPHEATLRRIMPKAFDTWLDKVKFDRVLDLACGSGEITLILEDWLKKHAITASIEATDPFTHVAYEQRCHRPCQKFSFEDIGQGYLDGKQFSLIICCFALHLVCQSRLFSVCQQMALNSEYFIIITPHKRPIIPSEMGWEIVQELLLDRIRIRLYRSFLFSLNK